VRALWAPHTGIVDFTKVAAAFANKFHQAGGDIFTGAAVKKITRSTGSVSLETTKGTLQAKYLINCAGLYADKVASMTGESGSSHSGASITPCAKRVIIWCPG